MAKEGWWFPFNSRKAHYIRHGRSFCGRWGYLGDGSSLEQKDFKSRDDCAACWRKRAKELGYVQKGT